MDESADVCVRGVKTESIINKTKKMKRKLRNSVLRSQLLLLLILPLLQFALILDSVFAVELKIRRINPIQFGYSKLKKPNQLPYSRVATGNKNIKIAWFGGATDRYKHGILGDTWEASQLLVETTQGNQLTFNLPYNRVFEDLEPRLVDLNGDKKDEVIVIESDINLGASLALYSIKSGQLKAIASTPFLGHPNRWLNPVGVGDFDGNGQPDIALVATPHIGGILRLYRFSDSGFRLFAEYTGVSTHKIGSMDLGLGRVVESNPKDLLILPNQSHNVLMLLEWTQTGIKQIAKVELYGRLRSSLLLVKRHHWRFQLDNDDFYELSLKE